VAQIVQTFDFPQSLGILLKSFGKKKYFYFSALGVIDFCNWKIVRIGKINYNPLSPEAFFDFSWGISTLLAGAPRFTKS